MALEFEWNPAKAAGNQTKHGVTFDEASTVLSDFFSVTIPDPLHSEDEERFVTIGLSEKGRMLVVVHTERAQVIRIISARIATKCERKTYEESHGYKH